MPNLAQYNKFWVVAFGLLVVAFVRYGLQVHVAIEYATMIFTAAGVLLVPNAKAPQ